MFLVVRMGKIRIKTSPIFVCNSKSCFSRSCVTILLFAHVTLCLHTVIEEEIIDRSVGYPARYWTVTRVNVIQF